MRLRVKRLLAILAAAVVALIAFFVIALHTSPVQSRILAWSIGELERRFSLDLTADRLHFNLFSRRVVMENVHLAAKGHHDDPFFSAQTVAVELPWAAYRGRLRFDAIEVQSGRVAINRDSNGVSNLPPGGSRDPNAPPRRLDVRGLIVRDLDFSYRDFQHDIDIEAPRIRTDLAYETGRGAVGDLAIDGGIDVRVGQKRTTMKPPHGRMLFDGSGVQLAGVVLDTTEGSFTLDGWVTRAIDRPTLDLAFKGRADIAVSSRWAPPPIHVAGSATIEATMKGPPTAFVLDAHVTSDDAEIGKEPRSAIDADSELTPNGIKVGRSTITPATGGEIHATLDVPFGQHTAWWVLADWRGIDAAAAFRLADIKVLPFGAALEGTVRIDRAVDQPYRLEAHNTSRPRAAQGTAPLEGTVEYIIEGDRWRANQSHRMGALRVNGRIGGHWNREAATQSTFEGNLAVQTDDIGESTRYAALFGLPSPSIVTGSKGPLQASVKMAGTYVEPRFIGTATSGGIDVPSLGLTALSGSFDVSPRVVTVTGIDATVRNADTSRAPGSEGAHIRGDVTADLINRKMGGQLAIDAPSAANLLSSLPESARLDGPLAATAAIGGTLDRPDVAIDVSGAGLTLAGQTIDSLTAKGHVLADGITVDSLTLKKGDGELNANGRYGWTTRTYTLEATGQDLTWRGTLPRVALGSTAGADEEAGQPGTLAPGEVEARFGLKFAGAGSIDQPVGEGAIDFTIAGGLAGELINRGIANIRLNGETATITARIPSLGAFINARVVPRSPFDFESVIVMNRINLAPAATLAGLREGFVSGTASLSASVKGSLSSPSDAVAFINLQDIQADVAEVPLRLLTPSRVSWDGHALSIDALDLTVGQGRLLAAGRLGEGGLNAARWQSTFKGELGDLLRIGRPFGLPVELDGSGPVTIEWASTGGLDRSTATMQLAKGAVSWASFPQVHDLVVDAAFNGTTLDVKRLTGLWQDGGIEGTASLPRAVLQTPEAGSAALPANQAGFVKLRVEGLSENALAPWLSPETILGIKAAVSATLDARITRASLDGISGALTFDAANFTFAGVQVSQVSPSVLAIENGLVTVRDVSFNAGGSPLTLTGAIHLTPEDKQSLELTLRGTADLKILSAFTPTVATDGEAKLNVGIGGPLKAPVFSGRIDIAGAEVGVRDPRILISEINGTIALDGQRVVFDSLTGSANGGGLTLDGGFLLDGFTVKAGGLTAQIQRAALEYPSGLQSEANAIVTLRPDETGWTLEGDIRVERSIYNQTISLAAILASRRSRTPTARTPPNWADRLRLNLFVSTDQDILLDNNYGRLEAGAALRVAGTVKDPVLAGRVTMREGGEVYIGGNTFRVSRGSISFTNPNRIVPEFDVELRTLVSGKELLLTVEGPLDRIQTDVHSTDPTIDSREAMSMLFGGLQGEDAVALLSAELLGATGRAIGLDSLRVQHGIDTDELRADPGLIATETDPTTRLTLSKRLRPDVELILSQSLRESGGLTAIVSYKPRRNIEIRTVSRDNVDRSIALRHEITFGGGQSAVVLPPQPKITSITITDDDKAASTDELRALLKLKIGDTFDFYRWQQDIDALRADYQKRNYYEARVRGSRQISEDGQTVALEYRIERGPVAVLVLEGHPLEPELVEDIRRAWMRTIFDRFLLEDIQSRIARHLLTEGWIGSKVEAVVSASTPVQKQITVKVSAGTEVDKRVIRYSGNPSIKADRLDAAVTAAGLGIDGWLDRAKVSETIKNFYLDEGYLAVAVRVDPPVVQGTIGVLPVTIEEGPRFLVAGLTFPGVSPERLTAVAAAVRIDSGVPFVTSEIDAARRRLEDFYGRQGFNSLQIEVNSTPNEDNHTVDVSFAILEGLQQILRDVTTTGATRTRDGIIRRALRLHVGEPVNLADWAQARKRMYDTNVFQQVDIEPVPLPPATEESAAGIQPVRAVVRVSEYPVWRLRYGAQFNDEQTDIPDATGDSRVQGIGILADVQNQNVLGRAITAGMAVRYERRRQAGSLFTSNGSFFGLPIRSSGFIFTDRQRTDISETFSTIDDRRGLSFEQRYRPTRLSELIWTYRFERDHTFDPDPAPSDPLPLDVVEKVSKVNLAMVLDRRDDPSNPTRGWFSAANFEQGVPIIGSTSSNGKLLLQESIYKGLGRVVVVAGRAQIGTGYGTESLIVSERFLLGGATTVRGYAQDSLGPRDILGLPGGDALLNFNAELRFPVRGWVKGVGFVDAGNVFASRGEFSLKDLAVGYGFGLRLATPFALLRVDFGIPARTVSPDHPGNQFGSGRVYFGIGHIF